MSVRRPDSSSRCNSAGAAPPTRSNAELGTRNAEHKTTAIPFRVPSSALGLQSNGFGMGTWRVHRFFICSGNHNSRYFHYPSQGSPLPW